VFLETVVLVSRPEFCGLGLGFDVGTCGFGLGLGDWSPCFRDRSIICYHAFVVKVVLFVQVNKKDCFFINFTNFVLGPRLHRRHRLIKLGLTVIVSNAYLFYTSLAGLGLESAGLGVMICIHKSFSLFSFV